MLTNKRDLIKELKQCISSLDSLQSAAEKLSDYILSNEIGEERLKAELLLERIKSSIVPSSESGRGRPVLDRWSLEESLEYCIKNNLRNTTYVREMIDRPELLPSSPTSYYKCPDFFKRVREAIGQK